MNDQATSEALAIIGIAGAFLLIAWAAAFWSICKDWLRPSDPTPEMQNKGHSI
jgi:hypothetical protein